MKSEPDAWSWDSQVKKGAKGEAVERRAQPYRQAQSDEDEEGRRGFFYHSNIGKEVVGIVEIIREHYTTRPLKKVRRGWWWT